MSSDRILKISVLGLALFAFSLVGCAASTNRLTSMPPRIDPVQAASQYDAPYQGSATRGRRFSSGSC